MGARPSQVFLLRAHLRLWLQEHEVASDEALDILVAASEAFDNAVTHARQPRSIVVHVEGRVGRGVVEIVVRDHGGWRASEPSPDARLGLPLMGALMDTVDVQATREGTTVRMQRALAPSRIEAGDRLGLLWRNPLFAPMPDRMLERLAARLIPVSASSDETIIHEGDRGDRFYLIADGRLDVSAASRHVATLGPGDHVGEIALLRHVPRTATIVAEKPAELFALTLEDFLSAVTSDEASRRAADRAIATRLAELESILGTARS